MEFEELVDNYSVDEFRELIKQSAKEAILSREDGTVDMVNVIFKIVDGMTDREVYERAYHSYISLN